MQSVWIDRPAYGRRKEKRGQVALPRYVFLRLLRSSRSAGKCRADRQAAIAFPFVFYFRSCCTWRPENDFLFGSCPNQSVGASEAWQALLLAICALDTGLET